MVALCGGPGDVPELISFKRPPLVDRSQGQSPPSPWSSARLTAHTEHLKGQTEVLIGVPINRSVTVSRVSQRISHSAVEHPRNRCPRFGSGRAARLYHRRGSWLNNKGRGSDQRTISNNGTTEAQQKPPQSEPSALHYLLCVGPVSACR